MSESPAHRRPVPPTFTGIEPVCEYFPDHEAAKASIMAARPDEMLQLLTT